MLVMFALIFLSILFSLLCLCCFSNNIFNSLLHVDFLSLCGVNRNFFINLDTISFGVILMLLICYGFVYFYTSHYFSQGVECSTLSKLILLFVGVMFCLVLTSDYMSSLIFWEYLGVVSFFLIIFYSNYLSLRSSVVTLVSSRFGDVSLFFLLGLSLYIKSGVLLSLTLFFLIVFTKSASFPFLSWLLEAMRAPTPVSSLVHSSTLVAAGVWFSMRYDLFNLLEDRVIYMYSLLLLLTVLITGISCFFFLDLKKIVALSTCNNVSWCVLYLILGDPVLSLFQLVSHGVSKCLLFMLVGDVMSGSGGSQNSNCVYSASLYGSWGIFSIFSVVLGLSGAPYIGVFFTKHFLLSGFANVENTFLFLLILLCVFLSYFYSFRFCSIILGSNVSLTVGALYSFGSGFMIYFWLFINFVLGNFMDEINSLSSGVSIFLILSQLICCFFAYNFYMSIYLSNWSSSLFGCDNLVEGVYNIFINLSNNVWLSIYRWDFQCLNIFSGFGFSSLNIYSNNVINFVIFGFILLGIYLILAL